MVAASVSGSSIGGFAPSSVGSSNASSHQRLRRQVPAEEGGEEVRREGNSPVEQGVFGVLFTLSKENSETHVGQVIRWTLLKIFLDGWQVLTTIVQPSKQGWDINPTGTAWSIVGVLNFTWLTDLGYGAYLAVLYSTVAALGFNLALCVWVAWCFKEQRFPVVWPIKVLRVFSSIFFQAFDVTSLNLLQLGFSCRFNGPTKPHLRMELFPSKSCSSMPHLIHAVVSGVSLVIFIAIALLLNMAEVEVNPLSRRPLALGHSGAEVTAFAIKALITLADVFLGWRRVVAVTDLLLAMALAWQYLRWSPHLVPWVNHLKTGSSAAVVYAAASLCLLVFNPGVDASDPAALFDWSRVMTIALGAGLVPAFGAGVLLSWASTRRMQMRVLKAFAEATADTPPADIYSFSDPKDVEMVARSCRQWRDRYHLQPAAVSAAHQVLKSGLALFPTSAFMALAHANFMIDVQGVCQAGSRQVEAARKLSPGLMCRFIIFVRQQQATQRAAGNNAGGGSASMDLLGYVEYQRKQRMVVRLHREALQAMCNFWKLLDSSHVSFTGLSKALSKIESSVSQAQGLYRVVLELYGNSPGLVRLYGKFLEKIKNDPWSAALYYAEAERLEEAKDNDGGPLLPDGTPLGRMDELDTAVFVLTAEGSIQMANKQSYSMLGYKRGLLEGKPVTSVVAPQCVQRITDLLAALVSASEAALPGSPAARAPGSVVLALVDSGSCRSVPGVDLDAEAGVAQTCALMLHRERVGLPVTVTVSRATGVGEDSTFIAMVELLPPNPDTASLWVSTNGVVTTCDQALCAHLGFHPADIIGAPVGNLLALDPNSIEAAAATAAAIAAQAAAAVGAQAGEGTMSLGGGKRLGAAKLARRAGPPSLMATLLAHSTRLDAEDGPATPMLPCLVAHKYEANPLACAVSLPDAEGAADVLIHEVRIQLTTTGGPHLLLIANRKGAIRYASPGVSAALLERAGGTQHDGPRLTGFGAALGSVQPAALRDVEGDRPAVAPAGAEALSGYSLKDFLPPLCWELHTAYLKDATPLAPPRRGMHSCCRVDVHASGQLPAATLGGPTLEMRSISAQPLYARVGVSSKELGGETLHIVRLKWSSVDVALAERRLRLTVAPDCTIADVSKGTPTQLLGFDPATLAGRLLWDVVQEDGARPNSSLGSAYAELMNRALSQPGRSWRVAVLPPNRDQSSNGSRRPTGHGLDGAQPVAAGFLSDPARVAFMQVHVASFDSTGAKNGAPLYVDLWPAEAVSGVLELDPSGRVKSVSEGATRPAGLLFGLPAEKLVGESLGWLVKLPPGRDAPSLLSLHGTAKKSSMKANAKGQSSAAKVGPVHVLPGWHVDGRPMALELRVLGRPDPGQPLTCLIRCHLGPPPSGGDHGGSFQGAALSSDGAPPIRSISRVLPGRLAVRSSAAGMLPAGDIDARCDPAGSPRLMAPPAVVKLSSSGSGARPATPPPIEGASSPFGVDSALDTDTVLPLAEVAGPEPVGGDVLTRAVSALPGPLAALLGAAKGAPPMPRTLTSSSLGGGGRPQGARARRGRSEVLVDAGSAQLTVDAPPRPAVTASDLDIAILERMLSVADPMKALDDAALGGDDDAASLPGSVNFGPPSMAATKGGRASDDGNNSAASSTHDDGPRKAPTAPAGGQARISTWVATSGRFYQNTAADEAAGGPTLPTDKARPLSARSAGEASAPRPPNDRRAAASSAGGVYPLAGAEAAVDDDAASEGGYSAASSQQSGHAGGGVEYKRGKRFKKLVKLMDSSASQHAVRRLKVHALIVLAILALVRTAFFAVSMNTIQEKRTDMLSLAIAGRAQLYMQRALFATRAMDRIYKNQTLDTLYTIADLPAFAETVLADAQSAKDTMDTIVESANKRNDKNIAELFYFRPLSIWSRLDMDGKDVFVNSTVWEAMSRFYTSCKQLYQVYTDHSASTAGAVATWQPPTLTTLPPFHFLLKTGPTLARSTIRKTIDVLLDEAVIAAQAVTRLQLAFLVAEGIVVTCVAAGYMAYLLRTVGLQRYKLYGTFTIIPVGLTRALATQDTVLNEEDAEEEDGEGGDEDRNQGRMDASDGEGDGLAAGTAGKQAKKRTAAFDPKSGNGKKDAASVAADTSTGADGRTAGRHRRRSSLVIIDLPPSLERSKSTAHAPSSPPVGPAGGKTGCWPGLMGKLAHLLTRRGRSVKPLLSVSGTLPDGAADEASRRRTLRNDTHDTFIILTPFLCWSTIVVLLYAIAVAKVESIIETVAAHGVVNIHVARSYRCAFFAQELMSERDPAQLPYRRAALLDAARLSKEAYFTAKLGASAYLALGGSIEVFPRVAQGIAYASSIIVGLLFNNRDCLRLGAYLPCPGPAYRFYEVSHMGLDGLVQEFLHVANLMAQDTSTALPGIDDPHFDMLYNVGTKDLMGGNIQLSEAHYNLIASVFDQLLLLHIIMFLGLWIVFSVFVFALLNPLLKRVAKEKRRIAELMSQLPLELDVEKLMIRALGNGTSGLTVAAVPLPSAGATGGSRLPAGPGAATTGSSVAKNGTNGTAASQDETNWRAILSSNNLTATKSKDGGSQQLVRDKSRDFGRAA